MYQHWTALLINNDNHRQELVSEIDEDDMDDTILNDGGVYCISGWLMNQLTKVKQKGKKNSIAKFLSRNRVIQSDSQDDVTASLPTDVFQSERSKGVN